ncbi:21442_t:CDS:2 [Rhizophagus irregularis]|nr:21442_t:CDS:2 [Rhizophagus irregularis]
MKIRGIFLAASILTLSIITSAEVYLKETFSDADWEKRWIQSQHRDDLGKFTVSSGNFYADEIESLVQFSVKHEQNIDCGGGYVKLLPPDFDALSFRGDSPYNIMFGPDICGSVRVVHLIINYKNNNKKLTKQITAPSDQLTHLYTLIIKSDQTYTVLIDNKEEASGKMEVDFNLLPPKEIHDAEAEKPADWDEEPLIPDPDDEKPDDWVDVPRTIPDPKAEKPDDWDDESDGDWEPPHISNPEFKGEWEPKMIENPKYNGTWYTPVIPNPDYKEDKTLHVFNTLYVGFDLWQVKSGTIFDNILITDEIEVAKKFSNETFVKYHNLEEDSENDENDDIVDLDVEIGPGGQVKVTKPDDLPPAQDNKSIQESTTTSESSPSPSSTKDENDELDKSFNEFEEEIGIHRKDEL